MARIRTIKPEFWSHPIMAKQDDATRLMAIALLNYADDEGFFHAEPNLVRGFCRPFDDDSTITRRCLDNLSKIGYISICNNDIYGYVGYVEKFSEHQRIDRPNDSKLKTYYSTNNRRTIDEQSTREGKGREGKGREGKEYSSDVLELINYSKIYFNEKYLTDKSKDTFSILLKSYSKANIEKVIEFGKKDSFWKDNFLSPAKLNTTNKEGVKYMDVFLAKIPKQVQNSLSQYNGNSFAAPKNSI